MCLTAPANVQLPWVATHCLHFHGRNGQQLCPSAPIGELKHLQTPALPVHIGKIEHQLVKVTVMVIVMVI
jgi:hypothetical protein